MQESTERLHSKVETIITILTRLLHDNNLTLSVDKKGNIYFKDKDTNLEAIISEEELNRIYNLQTDLTTTMEG